MISAASVSMIAAASLDRHKQGRAYQQRGA
jgi:hypothetical protein